MPGYYGFPSRKAYEDHYSDPAKYADEIPAMEAYAREADAERVMDDHDRKNLRAVEAVLDVADSNFPSDCDVTIHATGKNSATIRLPAFRLRALLKD